MNLDLLDDIPFMVKEGDTGQQVLANECVRFGHEIHMNGQLRIVCHQELNVTFYAVSNRSFSKNDAHHRLT